jgi:asparagine synthase (glutamine-hydrolysing)
MCGISGIISTSNKPIDSHAIRRMNDLIAHRGPDDEGFFFGKNFALGHRRLSIIDLSKDGHQPMTYLGKYTITYNGEVYNYLELKHELEKCGYQFYSKTDTEVILAAYDKWGANCVEHFNGMWAFAIYDLEKNIIFCSRDRFGIKPFYYAKIGNNFCLASEIKQFTTIEGWQAVMNEARVWEFLAYGIFDHTEETLFKGVYQLQGGHNLTYNLLDHSYKIQQWYNLKDKIKANDTSFDEATARLLELFTDSVRLRLRSDVKVGSCLSGGLDSSSIVTVMNQILKEKDSPNIQETVSSCFDIKQFDEREYIDEVIKHTKIISHKVFPPFENLFYDIDKIVWHQDEPFGGTSIFAQWKVFKEAQKHQITVMLDGQGADEQLAGYHNFFGSYFSYLIQNGKFKKFLHEINCFRKLHNYSLQYICQKIFKNFVPESFFIKAYLKTFPNFLYNKSYSTEYKPPQCTSIKELSMSHLTKTSLPMLLHYEDRNSMAHSIESRVPFIDYRLVEFIVGLPEDFKIKNGITKWILRCSLKKNLPEKILNRCDKMGFVTPEIQWLNEFKNIFRNEFLHGCNLLRQFIDSEKAEVFFDANLLNIYESQFVWRTICLGKWVNVFNVKSNSQS